MMQIMTWNQVIDLQREGLKDMYMPTVTFIGDGVEVYMEGSVSFGFAFVELCRCYFGTCICNVIPIEMGRRPWVHCQGAPHLQS